MKTVADIDKTVKAESDVEEPVIMTTVKGTHKVLDFVGNLQHFFVNQNFFSGNVILAISEDVSFFSNKEVILSRHCGQKRRVTNY